MSDSDKKDDKPLAVAPPPPKPDIALVHGVTSDGGYRILRRRGDSLELGSVHPLVEGKPLQGEVVALRPRQEFPLLCDVETLFKGPAPSQADVASPVAAAESRHKKGPAQVSNDSYRENWDMIWSRRKKDEAAN